MALADHYDEADILASLSWVGMPQKARVAKLANLYLDHENTIRRRHRNYEGATYGVVSLFVKSYYKPARGLGSVTYNSVIAEIPRQRKVREERKDNPQWSWPAPGNTPMTKRRAISARRDKVAAGRYGIVTTDWNDNVVQADLHCTAISRIADCTVIVDGGYRKAKPRVYLRNRKNEVKVIVLDMSYQGKFSITSALSRLAPKMALRGAFGGSTVTLDFEGEGFRVDGKLFPWRNVLKVYHGAEAAMSTPGCPEK